MASRVSLAEGELEDTIEGCSHPDARDGGCVALLARQDALESAPDADALAWSMLPEAEYRDLTRRWHEVFAWPLARKAIQASEDKVPMALGSRLPATIPLFNGLFIAEASHARHLAAPLRVRGPGLARLDRDLFNGLELIAAPPDPGLGGAPRPSPAGRGASIRSPAAENPAACGDRLGDRRRPCYPSYPPRRRDGDPGARAGGPP